MLFQDHHFADFSESSATASGADATRIVNRLREISVTTGSISGTQLNALLKARANGDGKEDSQKMLDAMTLVRRGVITSIADVTQKVPGLTKKQIEKLGDFIMDAGDRRLRETIRTMAGIPEGLVQMTGDQQRRFMKLNDMADRLKSEQIQSNGKWDTDLVIGELRTRLAADAEEKTIEEAKADLATIEIPKKMWGGNRTATLTADTPEKELKKEFTKERKKQGGFLNMVLKDKVIILKGELGAGEADQAA